MNSRSLRFLLTALCSVACLFAVGLGCTKQNELDILLFPAIVAVDSDQDRVFVVDNQLNGLNLIDALNNQILEVEDEQGLLTSEDPQLLPSFPNNAAVITLPGGVSRLFVIGGNAGPLNQVQVLDYDTVNSIRLAPISPIAVAGSSTDTLLGIAVNADLGQVYVTDATTAQFHIFDADTGLEDPASPIALSGIPGRISWDPVTGLIAVSNAGNNSVSLIDSLNLAGPVETFDVGLLTRDVSLSSNAAGTALFLTAAQENTAQVYQLNLVDLANSTQLFTITALPPIGGVSPVFLTGNLNQVKSGNLPDGRMAGFFTQSSGDLLVLDLTQNLSTVVPSIVTVGAVSGEGIDVQLNASGQVTTVYYASPGVGTLTIVDPLTNQFIDQIQ